MSKNPLPRHVTPSPTAKILTVNEAAHELRVGRSTLYNLLKSEELPSFKVANRRRIHREDVDKLVEARRNDGKLKK